MQIINFKSAEYQEARSAEDGPLRPVAPWRVASYAHPQPLLLILAFRIKTD